MAGIYTPDPTNSAQPADSDYMLMNAAEMRTLKGYIQAQLASLGGPLNTTLLRNKNFLDNGGFRINQRGAAAALTNGFNTSADRWRVANSGTGLTGTHNALTDASFDSGYCLSIAASWASGITYVEQRIESLNSYALVNKTATFSVKVYHDFSANTDFTVQVFSANAFNDFTAVTSLGQSTTSVVSGSVTKLAVTVNCGANAPNGILVQVRHASNTVVSKNIRIADAQLELGGYATSLEQKLISEELANCQRYYEKTLQMLASFGAVTTGNNYYHTYLYKKSKRTIPTITATLGSGASGFPTTRSVINQDTESCIIYSNANASLAGGYFWYSIELTDPVFG